MIKRITQYFKIKETFLFSAIALVNLGNYALNLLIGRILGPEHFAEVSVIATGVLILSFFGIGFQMTAAKFNSGFVAFKSRIVSIEKWLMLKAFLVGLFICAVLIISAHSIQSFLLFQKVDAIYILALGTPVYLIMSVGRGFFQGRLDFKQLAINYLIEMLSRFSITIILIMMMKNLDVHQGYTEVVAIGFVISFVASLMHCGSLRKSISVQGEKISNTLILSFIFTICVYEITQVLISYSDIMLVKHFFSNHEAGLYSGLALIGRIVYFATWSVVTMMFPMVIQREKEGKPHQHLFNRAFLFVVLTGAAVTFICCLFPDMIIRSMFGEAYLESSHLVWLYALSTTLFAASNVFAYYHMSLNRYLPVFMTGIFGIIQILTIYQIHFSLRAVIMIQIILMSCMLISMIVFHLVKNYHYEKDQTRNRFPVPA